ncbi:DUF4129 domain-containing protein [Pseudomonas sp. LP_7_YM]|uniref:DUF4129 domain-containing protein n=1 Tax=Pseudomonas sp. LP_7_YM TaxID=2485137 RepID=UPI00106123AB|nr:DUF4129 domain-containing protein [Pseudomonas sp. LP_7_YM]TDV70028.1 uncharacterized protein DUF4129 [Pseudomonas sp. LP_7_YM]
MRLTEAQVEIRPRNPWEAVDLGVLLARQHRRLLMTSWALVTLPVFLLLTVVLWDHPPLAVLLFWWLKPAYERLPLLILSQALFGAPPSLKGALKAWPRILKPQLLASLTWRRFSLSRSFILPVQQLERLDGPLRAQRIAHLGQDNLRVARCLTSLGSTLEICFGMSLVLLFYAFIPQQVELDWSWRSLLQTRGGWKWLEHLNNAFYALVLILWGPIYVSCGFALYLNRRTTLEAWDIELTFRRLRQRVIGSAYALLLGTSLIFGFAPQTVMADDTAADESNHSCPLPPLDLPQTEEHLAAPDAARLLTQPLTSEASRSTIKAVLASPPFKNPKAVSGWRLPDQTPEANKKTDKTGVTPQWLARVMVSLLNTGKTLATVFEAFLWGLITLAVGWIACRYRTWFSTFVSRDKHKPQALHDAPRQLFGLQVDAKSLPDDVASAAERLWSESPREALSLLYRALLNRLLTDYQLPLRNADTEGQVLERVAALNQPPLHDFAQELTRHWQRLAYGHELPARDVQKNLCEGWRQLLASGAST